MYNGHIVTVDGRFSIAEAVAIKNGAFAAVGRNDEIRRLATAATRTLDLRGRTVVPGLMDNHLHGAGGGPGVDLSRARSLGDVLGGRRRARQDHGARRDGDLNSDWHEAQLREQRLPLRDDLDTIAPVHARDIPRPWRPRVHIVNSAALGKWEHPPRQTPEPEGGRISRYPDGRLNG